MNALGLNTLWGFDFVRTRWQAWLKIAYSIVLAAEALEINWPFMKEVVLTDTFPFHVPVNSWLKTPVSVDMIVLMIKMVDQDFGASFGATPIYVGAGVSEIPDP
jgi:hypothetical protein